MLKSSIAAVFLLAAASQFSFAQQATVGTNYNNGGNSFFESNGVNFGFSVPGSSSGRGVVGLSPQGAVGGPIMFQQGGAGAAAAPFGNPSGGATFGYQINSPLGEFSFGLSGGQGDSRSNSSQAGDLTLQNGVPAFISDTSQRPFVTSIVPVVGGFVGASQPRFMVPSVAPPVASFGTSMLGERLERLGQDVGPRVDKFAPLNFTPVPIPEAPSLAPAAREFGAPQVGSPPAHNASAAPSAATSTASSPARSPTAAEQVASIADIRREQASEDATANKEMQAILDQAKQAMELGKPNVARIYYSQLARRATGPLQQAGVDGLKATEAAKSPR